jgi:hypothetical protein
MSLLCPNFWEEDRGPVCAGCKRHLRAHYNFDYCYSTGPQKFTPPDPSEETPK